MQRRHFISTLAAGSAYLVPARVYADVLTHGNKISVRCLGDKPGPRFLDGRTANATVGLAPDLSKKFSGTKWEVIRAGEGIITLKCLGVVAGAPWLDGRTATKTVGLAPNTNAPYTGTRWKIVRIDPNNQDIVALECLGAINGPRWLDGRTGDGSVGLAPSTDAPFTGTKWEVRLYPVVID